MIIDNNRITIDNNRLQSTTTAGALQSPNGMAKY
jgi:hypothetical protein